MLTTSLFADDDNGYYEVEGQILARNTNTENNGYGGDFFVISYEIWENNHELFDYGAPISIVHNDLAVEFILDVVVGDEIYDEQRVRLVYIENFGFVYI